MNWNRAKNLIIIFLLLLNVFLSILLYVTTEKKSLSVDQERAIYKYLSQNKVNFYVDITKDYPPMKQLNLLPVHFDIEKVRDIFFEKNKDVKISFEQEKIICRLGDETVIMNGNMLYYEKSIISTATAQLDKENAILLCEKFIEVNKKTFDGFILDRFYEQNGTYFLEYRHKYKSHVIYNNILKFELTGSYITQIECEFNEIRGLVGEEKEILSPDEAIYVFVQNLNYLYGEQEILIDTMDIVYLINKEYVSARQIITQPYYRFYIFGNEQPILINAYTGKVYTEV